MWPPIKMPPRACISLSTMECMTLPVSCFVSGHHTPTLNFHFHFHQGKLTLQPSIRRRTPRRSQNPQARCGQRRHQAVLEIPQRERAEEVRRQAEDWHREGDGEAMMDGWGRRRGAEGPVVICRLWPRWDCLYCFC